MKKRIVYFLAFFVILVMMFKFFDGEAFSKDRAQDGWGIVTDQDDNPVNNVNIILYRHIGEKKKLQCISQTYYQPAHGHGYYSWDAPTGFYDILVMEGTSDEGGWLDTYLEAGNWPNLVRNIKFGEFYAQKEG